jgi:DivIVA domain-containing protein
MAADGLSEEDVRSGQITFARKWRGYDPEQVDAALRAAERSAFEDGPYLRRVMARRLRDIEFRVVWRGYERGTVDMYTQLLIEEYLLPANRAGAGRDRLAP